MRRRRQKEKRGGGRWAVLETDLDFGLFELGLDDLDALLHDLQREVEGALDALDVVAHFAHLRAHQTAQVLQLVTSGHVGFIN